MLLRTMSCSVIISDLRDRNFLQKADLDTVRTYRLAQAKKIIGTSVREDDIVLADLRLPDGESTTLLQWMRENGYMHPFIMGIRKNWWKPLRPRRRV